MNIRKFWMTNGKGTTKQFADSISTIFLNNPTGLGMTNTLTSNVYQNQLNVILSEQNFGTIGGEMVFYDVANADKYSQYNDFVEFLTYKPLTLYYQIPTSPTETYSIDVDVLSLDKTEVKTNGTLRSTFSFQCLSRWKGSEITLTGSGSSYTITNGSHMPVGFEITIEGTDMENPYFTLTQDGDLYGEAKFDDSTGFNSVYVNSNDGKQSVELEQGGSIIANPLSYQDLSISNGAIYVTFTKLARGESTLAIGMDSGTLTSVKIKYTPIFRSV